MLSTKSRLLTRLPGSEETDSIDFFGVKPGTSGQTSGRSSSETKHSAGFGCVDVNGSRIISRGGLKREREHFAERAFGHADFVVRNRQAAFGDVENSLRRAAVAALDCAARPA